MGNKKVPSYQRQPAPSKDPKVGIAPSPSKSPKMPYVRGGPLAWRFSAVDKGGPFAWTSLDDAAVYKQVMEALHNFETMEENAIREAGSHPISVERCCKEAKDRLSELQLDDLDDLFSFRLSGKGRVWCRVIGSTMHVLWWDPEHQVCPSKLKHT